VHTPVHASWLTQIEIYFSIIHRNVRTIDLLIDEQTILSGGAAATGAPWKYFNLQRSRRTPKARRASDK